MNENLNLNEILKDCPAGVKFYSSIYGDVYFNCIDLSCQYSVILKTPGGERAEVLSDGRHYLSFNGECTLFPSKDQRDWSKWYRPFMDGDILFTYTRGAICNYEWLSIFKRIIDNKCETYVDMNISVGNRDFYINDDERKYFCDLPEIIYQRLATEEEKKRLFDAIKDCGFKWNSETKILEKLSNNKFNPNIFKPFDRVLVRDDEDVWHIAHFSHIDEKITYKFIAGTCWKYCIPYNDDTAHLIGTDKEAPKFYRYWEE